MIALRPPKSLLVLLAAVAAMLAPNLVSADRASAATVVNGDFEAGGLKGWHTYRVTEAGNWFAYGSTNAPIGSKRKPEPADPVQAPPQGAFAAIADQANPDTLILYQDVALEAGESHLLSLLAYYDSYKPIAVPAPDTLSVAEEALGGQANQQFRIDVIRPGAPLESLDPADILSTLFQTKPGAPARMKPTKLTADLSPFAGQTVRLRIAVAAHEEVFNAGVDAVALGGNRGSKAPGADRLGFGKPRPNRKNGTVLLPVRVPGPGLVTATKKGAIRSVTVKAAAAKTLKILLRPTASTRALLVRRHKRRVTVTVVFKPAGEPRQTAAKTVVFRLAPGPKK
jgi:hypothetical protein